MLSPRPEFAARPRERSSTVSSTTSSSSFEFANAETASEGYSETSGDEIVWNLAGEHQNEARDDDFVVLSRRSRVEDATTPVRPAHQEGVSSQATPRRCTAEDGSLADTFDSHLRISPPGLQAPEDEKLDNEEDPKTCEDEPRAMTRETQSLPTPEVTPTRDAGAATKSPLAQETSFDALLHQPKSKSRKKKSKARSKHKQQISGVANCAPNGGKKARQEKRGENSGHKAESPAASETPVNSSVFKEASDYISSFLSSPEARANNVCRLTLLQSLIVELGLISSVLNLPASLKAAKNFLKSKAFLNVKEYIAVRGQGQEAIRKVLYPNRSALVKALRTGKRSQRANLQWVKDHGLQVLLVGCFR